ncbi:MAG: hypothetical protein WBA97_09700 [Actinophytocola sp.]|uniref:hypothetical protein n=1 Tax=Actinophytocola sp. TaxID=1872138 RepID=UPI003C7207DF
MHKGIELRDEIIILAPTGTLDAESRGTLRERLLVAASDEPHAVVVNISALYLPDPTTLFAEVAGEVLRWPGVRLLVVDPRGQVAGCYRSVDGAIAAVGKPPPRKLARRTLPNTRSGGRAGRAFVRDCCRRWDVEENRAADAVWVANELIENTIRHTPYQPSLRVELRGGELTVAVADDDPTTPRADAGALPLHGLGAVHRLATAWGSTPTTSGGKVVWAAL